MAGRVPKPEQTEFLDIVGSGKVNVLFLENTTLFGKISTFKNESQAGGLKKNERMDLLGAIDGSESAFGTTTQESVDDKSSDMSYYAVLFGDSIGELNIKSRKPATLTPPETPSPPDTPTLPARQEQRRRAHSRCMRSPI